MTHTLQNVVKTFFIEFKHFFTSMHGSIQLYEQLVKLYSRRRYGMAQPICERFGSFIAKMYMAYFELAVDLYLDALYGRPRTPSIDSSTTATNDETTSIQDPAELSDELINSIGDILETQE